jgi:hypothetical protein
MKHVKGFMVDGIVEIYRLWNPSGNANCAQIHAGGYLRRIFGSLARKGCVSRPNKIQGGSPLTAPYSFGHGLGPSSMLRVASWV